MEIRGIGVFEKLYGNENSKRILTKLITDLRNSRDSFSSLLFLGKSGVGKKLFALEFARGLNCLNSGETSCKCSSCIKYQLNAHPNIILEDSGDKAISVDLSRKILEESSLCADEGQIKVVILNNAEKLTKSATNALLKLMEDGRRSTIFVLITSNKDKLLPTLQSRLKIIPFSTLSEQETLNFAKNELKITDEVQLCKLVLFSNGIVGRMTDKELVGKVFYEVDVAQNFVKMGEIVNLFKLSERWAKDPNLLYYIELMYKTSDVTNTVKEIENSVYYICEPRCNKELALKNMFLQLALK